MTERWASIAASGAVVGGWEIGVEQSGQEGMRFCSGRKVKGLSARSGEAPREEASGGAGGARSGEAAYVCFGGIVASAFVARWRSPVITAEGKGTRRTSEWQD